MPNWCEGTLKVRGTKEDIKRFLIEAVNPVGFLGDEVEPKTIQEDQWEFTLKSKHHFHIKGTHRNFIESNIEFHFDTDDDIKICVIENFKAAWGIEPEPLAKLSKEYNIDFKIYAFERGKEFNLDLEIHKGDIVKYEEIEFQDYQWECISPHLGG